jgi:hypothetical protein
MRNLMDVERRREHQHRTLPLAKVDVPLIDADPEHLAGCLLRIREALVPGIPIERAVTRRVAEQTLVRRRR